MNIKRDILWNYISLAIMAAVGFAINTVIIHYYDSSVLGMYNETYAWYMIISQIAVWGTHMAVLKFVPETDDEDKRKTILSSAIIVSIISSCITMLITYVVVFFLDIEWKVFLYRAIMGLALYSINKILLNYLNGISQMTLYALVQIVRYITLFIVVLVLSICHTTGDNLSFTFPITECIVLFVLILIFMRIEKGSGHIDIHECRKILSFGTKILPSNMVLEINSKVDVVCLGFFIKDMGMIGIYSFAIYFTDGMYQLFIVLRRLLNPYLAKANIKGELDGYLKRLNNQLKKPLILFSAIGYVTVVLTYYLISRYIVGEEFTQGIIFLIIIGGAIVLTGRYIIFGNFLAQTGHPLDESKVNILTVCINVAMNCILICLIGMIGAAISTAFSYIVFALLLKYISKKRLMIEYP